MRTDQVTDRRVEEVRTQPTPTRTQPTPTKEVTPTTSTAPGLNEQKKVLVQQAKDLLLKLEQIPGSVTSSDYILRIREAFVKPAVADLEEIVKELSELQIRAEKIDRAFKLALQNLNELGIAESESGSYAERYKSGPDGKARLLLVQEMQRKAKELNESTRLLAEQAQQKKLEIDQLLLGLPETARGRYSDAAEKLLLLKPIQLGKFDLLKRAITEAIQKLSVVQQEVPPTQKPPTQKPTSQPKQPTPPPKTPPTLTEARSKIDTCEVRELKTLTVTEKIELLGPVAAEVKRIRLEIAQVEKELKTATGLKQSQLEQKLKELKSQRDREQQVCNKLYKVTPLDEKFRKHDVQQRQKYLKVLAENRSLENASNPETWKTIKNEDKKKLMQQALEQQYAVLCPGSKAPEIQLKYWPDDEPNKEKVQQAEINNSVPQGNYNPNTHQITFWVYQKDGDLETVEKGPLKDFKEAIDTAIHETSHAYQNELVKQLNEVESGKRTPPPPQDWEIDQAKLFRLNEDAYEDNGLDNEAYKKEPLEIHAWLAGGTAALLFDYDAQFLDLQRHFNQATGWFPEKKDQLSKALLSVKGQSGKLAEKGSVLLSLKEVAEKLLGEVPKVREQPARDFDVESKAVSQILDEFSTISLSGDIYSKYAQLFDTQTEIKKVWMRDFTTGPLASLLKCVTDMATVKNELSQLKPLAESYGACKAAREQLVTALNGVDSKKFSELHWSEYQTVRELFLGYDSRKEELAKASDAVGLRSLHQEILKAVSRAGKLPKKG